MTEQEALDSLVQAISQANTALEALGLDKIVEIGLAGNARQSLSEDASHTDGIEFEQHPIGYSLTIAGVPTIARISANTAKPYKRRR